MTREALEAEQLAAASPEVERVMRMLFNERRRARRESALWLVIVIMLALWCFANSAGVAVAVTRCNDLSLVVGKLIEALK